MVFVNEITVQKEENSLFSTANPPFFRISAIETTVEIAAIT